VDTSPVLQVILELAVAGFRLSDSTLLSSSSLVVNQVLLDFEEANKRKRELNYKHHFTAPLSSDRWSTFIDGVLGYVHRFSDLHSYLVIFDLSRQYVEYPYQSEKSEDLNSTELKPKEPLIDERSPPNIKHKLDFSLLIFTFDAEQDLLVLFEDGNRRWVSTCSSHSICKLRSCYTLKPLSTPLMSNPSSDQ
jgi:hypothetical protein